MQFAPVRSMELFTGSFEKQYISNKYLGVC